MVTANVRALCRCGIRIPSARNRCPAFVKDKYLQPMFGDVGQARTNAAMLLLPIATTLSRTCTKPIVGCSFYFKGLINSFPFVEIKRICSLLFLLKISIFNWDSLILRFVFVSKKSVLSILYSIGKIPKVL